MATERLVLEPVEVRHSAAIHAAVVASIDHLLPWMPWALGVTEDRIAAFNREAETAWREGRSYGLAMVRSGPVVGIVTLLISHGGVGEVGYWVAVDHAGQGLATEAARALLRFAFEDLRLYRVELRAGADNLRSLRVAEKLGFTREGLLRNGLDGSEGPFDTYMFGITPEEWARQTR